MDDAKLIMEGIAMVDREGRLGAEIHAFPVVGVNAGEEGFVGSVAELSRAAEQRPHWPGLANFAGAEVQFPGDHLGRLEGLAQPFLAFLKGLFGQAARPVFRGVPQVALDRRHEPGQIVL